jgi:hypothetical protein
VSRFPDVFVKLLLVHFAFFSLSQSIARVIPVSKPLGILPFFRKNYIIDNRGTN